MKKILFILLIITFSQCEKPEVGPEMERFIQTFDGKNMSEISEELKEGLNLFTGIEDQPLYRISHNLKNVAKIDEKYSVGYIVDTTMVPYAMTQFKDMGFEQRFEHNESMITFGKKDMPIWSPVPLPKRIQQHFSGQIIYYTALPISHDGYQYLVDFSNGTSWGNMAVIDSIQLSYSLKYPVSIDSLFLSKEQPDLTYRGKKIKLLEQKDNSIHLRVPVALLDQYEVVAFNEEGKPLVELASMTAPRSPKDQKVVFNEMHHFIEKLQRKITQNSFKTPDEFKTYLRENLVEQPIYERTDYSHNLMYFRGNVSRVGLYFISKSIEKTTEFIAKSTTTFGAVIPMLSEKGTVFLNQALQPIFEVDSLKLESLGERYFYANNKYYHLNIQAKKVSELNAEKVIECRNGIALIQPKNQLDYRLVTRDNQPIKSKIVTRFHEISDQLIAVQVTGGQYYMVDQIGKMTLLSGVKSISNLQEDRIAVERFDGKYGFFNAKGNVVIPYQYDFAMDFSDGLAAVRKDGNYGFINAEGKTVLPFKFIRVTNFLSGVAFVSTPDSLYLIDKLGVPKVKTKRKSWGISGRGINRVYQLGDRYYNLAGEEVPIRND